MLLQIFVIKGIYIYVCWSTEPWLCNERDSNLQFVQQTAPVKVCVHVSYTYPGEKAHHIKFFHMSTGHCMCVNGSNSLHQLINYRPWLVYDAFTPCGWLKAHWIRSLTLRIHRERNQILYQNWEVGKYLETFILFNGFRAYELKKQRSSYVQCWEDRPDFIKTFLLTPIGTEMWYETS